MTDVQVTREPLTYEETSPYSFFWDLARAEARNDKEARARLAQHSVEMRVTPNGTAGTGGELIPPAWLMGNTTTAAKIGRHLADLIGSRPLPRGVNQINIPRIIGTNILGQDTAIQAAQNSAVQSIDDATAANTSPVVSIAGVINISQQLLDQSPIAGPIGDDIYYTELMKDYDASMSVQIMNGTGTGGQLLGLANFAYPAGHSISGAGVGITSPTAVSALWPLLGQAAAAVGNDRGLRPDFWYMAPRRWFSMASNLDSSGRPISSPSATATKSSPDPFDDGPNSVANVMGIPVFTGGSIPAGPIADTIYCARVADMYLYESDARIQTSVNSLGGTLTVRLSYHRYVAFVGNLYTSAIARVTAIPPPTNF